MSWRRPDKKFHFPCEGLAEGHSPTDYDPGMAEMLAASLSEAGPSRSQVLGLVRMLPSERAPRGGEAATSRSFTSGAWAKDGAVGLRHNSSLFPESTKILTALIREAFPSATFCAVAVFSDLKAEPRIDSNNDARFMNRILPLSSFQGGSVWVESDQGSIERFYRGRKRRSVLLDVASGPVSLDSASLHATEPWVGSRVVLVAYCPRDMHKLGDGSLKVLRSLGFRPPDPPCGSPHVPLHGPCHPRNLPSQPVSAKKKVATQPLSGPSGPQVHIDNSRPRARPASRPYALEVFCGSGGLSIALRRWAIDTLGVDHLMPRTGARFPMVRLDLRKPEHQRILWREIRQTDVIWLAPPCGTASKARTIPINKTSRAAGAPTPRPLRGSRFPEGFPWLRGVAKDKVASANALYAFASKVWLCAQEAGKISVVENPASSWMWQTKWFRRGVHVSMAPAGRKRLAFCLPYLCPECTRSAQVAMSICDGVPSNPSRAGLSPRRRRLRTLLSSVRLSPRTSL